MSASITWTVEGVAAGYGRELVLRDVDLELPPAHVTAVVGGDGAGKTTLLRCLAGSLAPRRGHLSLPAHERIGYVSEAPGVWGDLTVVENLRFSAGAYGLGRSETAERINELLAVTGLGGAHDRLAADLSGGMRQKLAFAAAVLHRPDLLILDEATTGVDPVSRRDVWRMTARVAADGAAVVLATTYLDEAERAGTVMVLHDGTPLLRGVPGDVIASMPGHVSRTAQPLPGRSWRRGREWRTWSPDPAPRSEDLVDVDLEDVVLVELLRREQPDREEVVAGA